MPYLYNAERLARKQQVSPLKVIGLTRPGIELLIFRNGGLGSVDWTTTSGMSTWWLLFPSVCWVDLPVCDVCVRVRLCNILRYISRE